MPWKTICNTFQIIRKKRYAPYFSSKFVTLYTLSIKSLTCAGDVRGRRGASDTVELLTLFIGARVPISFPNI